METGNYFIEYEKVSKGLFEKLKQQYLHHMDNARDWKIAHDIFCNTIMPPYNAGNAEKLTALGPGIINNFIKQWENRYQLNKSKERPEIFNELIVELIESDKRVETVKLLGEQWGLATMNHYLSKQESSWLNSQIKKAPDEINKKYQGPIHWKGQNETELVQLVYALHEAGLLENEEKEITKLVEDFAYMVNFGLGKNWQVNLSTSIHKRNSDYVPKIFDNLKGAYDKLHAKRIEKKKKI